MNNLTSGNYHYCRDYVKSVTVLSRCISVVERGRGGVTVNDLKMILKGCSLKAEDRRAIDIQGENARGAKRRAEKARL